VADDLAPGGVAMSWTVGYSGDDVRADVEITVTPANEFGYQFKSNVSPLYDDAIREQIESVAQEFGNPGVFLDCIDSGALPMTWSARLTAAFCLALNRAIPAVQSSEKKLTNGLRRSRLYVPGNTPKLIPNAPLFGADVIILDLEESVHCGRKTEALAMVARACSELDWGRSELMVRVNAGELGRREMRVLGRSGVQTFILPKIESGEEVVAVDELLTEYGSDCLLFPLVESALGVENAFEIAKSSSRVTAISLGLEDYVADIGATRTLEQSESAFARARVLNAARAAGVAPLASVFPRFQDLSEVEEYARMSRAAGYEGVGCIHPNQIEAVHRGFAPTEKELKNAHQVVEAFESAQLLGSGAVGVNGSMADLPTYLRSKRIIKQAGGGL
jgi:citrate lyase subunit beta / citryl-CoA lyase